MNEYERALWHVVAGWAFHDEECPASESDEDDICTCGFQQAMRDAHDAYKRRAGTPAGEASPP